MTGTTYADTGLDPDTQHSYTVVAYDAARNASPPSASATATSGTAVTAIGPPQNLTDFVIDPGTSELTGTVSVNGKEAATDAVLFDLDGSTLNPLKTNADGSATLEGTTVLLSDDAASLLNDTFGITDLQGGIVIGISSITVAG